MLLQDKVAIIHGAGGAIGSATAHAFARQGAQLFLAGRNLERVALVAAAIRAEGGRAEAMQLDVLNEVAVERHATAVANAAGRIDIVFNAVGFDPPERVPLLDLSYEDFAHPIASWMKTQFLTSRSAARHMVRCHSGVVITLSPAPARLAVGMTGGFGVACVAIEAMTRTLAAEIGPQGVRAVCLSPYRIAGMAGFDDNVPVGRKASLDFLKETTMPSPDDIANTAVFLASDAAASTTGAVGNVTVGTSVD